MRLRTAAAVVSTAGGLVLAPFAAPASAVTTTSTIVAYTADTDGDGKGELFTRPADGSGTPTKVYDPAYDIDLPSLSPDGTKIAFTRGDVSFGPDLTLYRLWVRDLGTGAMTLVLDENVPSSVGWSTDGTQIVASTYDPLADTWGTYVVAADGSGTPALVPGTAGTSDDEQAYKTYGEEPSFAPSGDVVAIDAFNSDYDYVGIDLISLTSGKRARVAGTVGGSDPVWSPDGQYLLFQRFLTTCGVGLYRVPARGGSATTVREVAKRFLGSAEYSRDGSQLVWNEAPMSMCGTKALGEIFIGNADGTAATRIAITPAVSESGTTVAGGTPLVDSVAPAAPAFQPALLTASTVKLTWTATDNDVVEYVVLRKDAGAAALTSPTDGQPVYRGPARTATATGLTPNTVSDFYVYGVDASGNESAVSAVRSARTVAAPSMRPSPRVGISTVDTKLSVRWTPSAGATSYRVLVGQKTRGTSGVWSKHPTYATLVASTAETSHVMTGGQGKTYYFRVRAFDEFGNGTPDSAQSAESVPIDDSYGGFAYSASWATKASAVRYLGGYHTTITRNATFSARLETSRFVLLGDRCDTCGKFQVYVDGVLKGTFDSHTPSTTVRPRQTLYVSGAFATIKPHTIKVVALGTSGRPRVSIDGLRLQR